MCAILGRDGGEAGEAAGLRAMAAVLLRTLFDVRSDVWFRVQGRTQTGGETIGRSFVRLIGWFCLVDQLFKKCVRYAIWGSRGPLCSWNGFGVFLLVFAGRAGADELLLAVVFFFFSVPFFCLFAHPRVLWHPSNRYSSAVPCAGCDTLRCVF